MSSKKRSSFWTLFLYFLLGFVMLRLFRAIEFPYWLGALISFSVVFYLSRRWTKRLMQEKLDEALAEMNPSRPIAGIESVFIDGDRHYYAYDFSSDEVVSPLFESELSMADFGAQHLQQVDGLKAQEYWLEIVAYAKDESQLFDDVPTLNLQDVENLRASLEYSKNTGKPDDTKTIEPFISDVLLHLGREHVSLSNVIASDSELQELESEDLVEMVQRSLGNESTYEHIDVSQASELALAYWDALVEQVDPSWHKLLVVQRI